MKTLQQKLSHYFSKEYDTQVEMFRRLEPRLEEMRVDAEKFKDEVSFSSKQRVALKESDCSFFE